MKIQLIHKNFVLAVLMASAIVLFSGCLKKSDAVIKPSTSIPFKATSLLTTLDGQSSLHLFNLAFKRLSLDSTFDANINYTIFAPTDSAMKAVGLDSAGVSKLKIDSLRKLITYQICIGAFDENTLTNSISTEQVYTLRQDVTTTPHGGALFIAPLLFVKESDRLYFNGIPLGKKGTGIQTSNGFIYPVDGFMPGIPSRTIYDVIQSDPDLSMYNRALIVEDSVLSANGVNGGHIARFSNPGSIYTAAGMLPTVLAPTNKAFNDAGFHTDDDLVRFATRYRVGINYDDFTSIYFSSLDTLLNHHVLYNSDVNGAVRIFYNDLLSPAINASALNAYQDGPTYWNCLILNAVPLIFSANNGIASVKWNKDAASQPIIIPLDASPLHPVNNFRCSNGALYKIDKLFYPIAK